MIHSTSVSNQILPVEAHKGIQASSFFLVCLIAATSFDVFIWDSMQLINTK